MGTVQMTREQVQEFLRGETLGYLKDALGPAVKEAVEASVAKNLAAPPWIKGLLEGQRRPDEPKPRTKGEAFGCFVRCLIKGKNDPERAAKIARTWHEDEIADQIEKAMTAADPSAGGFLVPEAFSTDVIELLRAAGVVRRAGPRTIPMTNGNMNIPKVTSGVSGSYIGENTNITKSAIATGQVTLRWRKLAVLVPLSNDLLAYSSPSADTVVRDDVVRYMSSREDSAFIRDDGTSGTPKGMRYWAAAANLIAANGTESLANTTVDLGKLVQQLMKNNIPMTRPRWLISPRTYRYLTTVRDGNGNYAFRAEMLAGNLWGWPFFWTTNIPETLTSGANTDATEIYIADFDDVVIGESPRLRVDASGEAAYHDGSAVQAAFSRDETVVRAIASHDFVARRDESIAVLTGVRWGV